MPMKKARIRKNKRAERNLHLIEWTAGILGVFWGVWWGFFMQNVLESQDTATLDFSISALGNSFHGTATLQKTQFLLISVVTIAFYVHYFVRWLWAIHALKRRNVRRRLFPVLLVMTGLCSAIHITARAFSVDNASAVYGIALTWLWPVVILLVTMSS